MNRISALLLVVLVAAAAGQTFAQGLPSREIATPQATVSLIAERAALAPGGSVSLGLRFQQQPEWHIYWQNPGDSGGPPTVQWRLPAGVTADPIEWPAPVAIEFGGLINYGYWGDIVLPVRIRAAKTAALTGPISVGASLRWLICKDICIPGKAELLLALPLAGKDQAEGAAWTKLIEQARARVPRPAPATWKATAASEGDFFTVSVQTGSREATGIFFPLEVSQVNDSAPQEVTPLAGGIRFKLKKSDQLAKIPATLKGVVSVSADRAFTVEAPVAPR